MTISGGGPAQRFLAGLLLILVFRAEPAAARSVTDAAGRAVEIPDGIERVIAAGPPASIFLYTLAPEKMVGWVREPSAAEREFLAQPYADLPAYGRLTGRGGTANLETIVAARPDLIFDLGTVDPTYASLADRVQGQTGIPYVLLDGSLAATPATFRTMGEWLGLAGRAEELARAAEATLAEAATLAHEPAGPRVYYGRGPDGLETGLAGSINVEMLEAVGATNVAAAAGHGGLARVDLEQVLAWNPDIIITLDPNFYAALQSDGRWAGIAAVRDGRIHLAPSLPFGWFDSPPGVNRLIGVRWLEGVLYPDRFAADLPALTRDFYRRFYHVEVTDAQLDRLLHPGAAKP